MARLLGRAYPDVAVVRVQGTPYEMGRQHGIQIGNLVRESVSNATSELTASSQYLSETQFRRLVEKHRAITEKLRPEQFEELRGVAEGASVDYTLLLRMFLARELPYGFAEMKGAVSCAAEECTSWGAAGEATTNNEPLLAQNRDCPYESGQHRIIVVAQPRGRHSFVVTGRAGSNDGYGVNKKGLAIMAPAVRPSDSLTAPSDDQPPGVQSYTLARMILETCENSEEAVDLVKSTPPGYMGLNWLIVDRDNHIAKVERSYKRVNVRHPEEASYPANKVIAATNHYSSREMSSLTSSVGASTRKRYDRIAALLTTKAGTLDFETFLQFARDHHDGPSDLSICNHGQDLGTNLSMIAQSKLPRLWVLRGSPCLNDYVAYDCP